MDKVLAKWAKWAESLDVPVPFIRSNKPWKEKRGLPLPKFEKEKRVVGDRVLRRPPSEDDIFIMDNMDSQHQPVGGLSTPSPAWKVYVAPKCVSCSLFTCRY